MDLATITMDKADARRAFIDYRNAVRERHTAEDAQIMRGYRALARGQQVINLREVLRDGGCFDDGLPRLAVAQSDSEWVWLARRRDGAVTFLPAARIHHNRKRGVTALPPGTLPTCLELGHSRDPRGWCDGPHDGWWSSRRRAMVPIVPPALRPVHSLESYWTLFEVPQWLVAPRPPGDPALLKHIGGELYAVIAIWDLTPLEQAVLAGRGVHAT
jgi:hypothetical protein